VQEESVAQQELDEDGMTVESECQESNAMDNIMAEADNYDSEYVQHAQSKRKEVEVEKLCRKRSQWRRDCLEASLSSMKDQYDMDIDVRMSGTTQ